MKWLWVSGWGVSPRALQSYALDAFPGIIHQVMLPNRLADESLHGFDRILGWSLGGYRVLEWLVTFENRQSIPPIVLFAPFVSFCLEDLQGGKTSRTQVKFLARWMKRDPDAALADFFQRAGLSRPFCEIDQDCLSTWTTELFHLANDKLEIQKVIEALKTTNVQILVGESDPLVDPSYLIENLGGTLVPKVGHDLAGLVPFLK